MSVIRCELARQGRAGNAKGGNSAEVRTYRRTWNVTCDTSTDDENTIIDYFRSNRNRVQFLGDAYPRDRSTICVSISPRLDKSSPTNCLWVVDQEFEQPETNSKQERPDANADNGQTTDDPTQWFDIDAGAYNDTVPVYLATYHSGIDNLQPGQQVMPMNSAGVPFDPPLEKEITIETLRVSWYLREWRASDVRPWFNVVNANEFRYRLLRYDATWPKFAAKIKSITGSFKLVNGEFYWRRTSEIHIHPDGWRVFVPNIGTAALAKPGEPNGKGGTFSSAAFKQGMPRVRKLLDVNGKSIQNKIFLDAKGQPIGEGDPPTYVEYAIYKEDDFQIAWNKDII